MVYPVKIMISTFVLKVDVFPSELITSIDNFTAVFSGWNLSSPSYLILIPLSTLSGKKGL